MQDTGIFDTSETARGLIHRSLTENSIYNQGSTEQPADDYHSIRERLIRSIFESVGAFHTGSALFKLDLSHGCIYEGLDRTVLFDIANALCRHRIQNFHFIAHGAPFHPWERFGRYQASWNYGRYAIMLYTRAEKEPPRTLYYFMRITDTADTGDETSDSDNQTDEEDIPPRIYYNNAALCW